MSSPNESTASRLQRIGRRTDAIPEQADRFQDEVVSQRNMNVMTLIHQVPVITLILKMNVQVKLHSIMMNLHE